jgi:hypothetical protein
MCVLIAGIAGSNPAEGTDVRLLLFVCCVGSGFCRELITRTEGFHRVCVCLIVCDLETSSTTKQPRPELGYSVTESKQTEQDPKQDLPIYQCLRGVSEIRGNIFIWNAVFWRLEHPPLIPQLPFSIRFIWALKPPVSTAISTHLQIFNVKSVFGCPSWAITLSQECG